MLLASLFAFFLARGLFFVFYEAQSPWNGVVDVLPESDLTTSILELSSPVSVIPIPTTEEVPFDLPTTPTTTSTPTSTLRPHTPETSYTPLTTESGIPSRESALSSPESRPPAPEIPSATSKTQVPPTCSRLSAFEEFSPVGTCPHVPSYHEATKTPLISPQHSLVATLTTHTSPDIPTWASSPPIMGIPSATPGESHSRDQSPVPPIPPPPGISVSVPSPPTLAPSVDYPKTTATTPESILTPSPTSTGTRPTDASITPKFRSMWKLVIDCAEIIGIYTYLAIHPNLPDREASKVKRIWERIKTTLYALLAPEAVLMWAVKQRLVAARIAKQYEGLGWTKTHGYFVQMGGLVLDVGNGYRVVTIAQDGQIQLRGEHDSTDSKLDSTIILPTISEAELLDKSKYNALSKILAIMHLHWFVVQYIARYTQGLAITELEVITLAYALLNTLTNVIWWGKPANIEYPVYFYRNGERKSGPDGPSGRWGRQELWEKEWYTGLWPCKERLKRTLLAICAPLKDMARRIANAKRTEIHSAGDLTVRDWRRMVSWMSIVGALFGGIHVMAWDTQFSSPILQVLWRACLVIITTLPLLIGLLLIIHDYRKEYTTLSWWKNLAFVLVATCCLVATTIYMLFRFTSIVLVGLTFQNLLDSARYESANLL
ncbi:hypothetical protein AX16_003026 [Volvariella volvacea WC 439]|nr:hypothetical protein AX16_003026 [Volvariella volvacea WC 439]